MVVEGGYIRVVQDVRGKHGSEGDYVVNRPCAARWNKTPVDHATDTFLDTYIDWLVKNVPETNVARSVSWGSRTTKLPAVDGAGHDPHLRLSRWWSVPMNPMVDGWRGDDWFHYRAFRQLNVSWIYEPGRHAQGGRQGGGAMRTTTMYAGHVASSGLGWRNGLGRQRGMEQTRLLDQARRTRGLRRLLAGPGR